MSFPGGKRGRLEGGESCRRKVFAIGTCGGSLGRRENNNTVIIRGKSNIKPRKVSSSYWEKGGKERWERGFKKRGR